MEEEIILIIVFAIALLLVAGIVLGVLSSKNNYREKYRDDHQHERWLSSEQEYKGFLAERSVAILLKEISDKIGNSFVINDLIIPCGTDANGETKTTEIDHVLFTRSGLFVFETKSRAGVIIGNENDAEWRQLLGRQYKKEHRFQNPIKQNASHIKAIKYLLNKMNLVTYSCVVFYDGDIGEVDSDIVITPAYVKDFVYSRTSKEVYNDFDVSSFYTKIKYYKDHPPKTKEEHAKEMMEIHSNIDA